MKKGIVDVGGGLRGVYAAGVLDYCLDVGLRFDLGIGVSAGSANLFSFGVWSWQKCMRLRESCALFRLTIPAVWIR